MKKVILMLMVITGMTIIFTACNKEAEIAPNDAIALEKALTPEVLISDYALLENPQISEPALFAEFTVLNDGTCDEELPIELNESTGKLNCHKKIHDLLYFHLTQLDLTKEQSIKIHYALKEFHKCKMFNHAMMRKLNHEILMKANKERMHILDKLKNNEITKLQAEKALKELHLRIQHIMKNDPARKKVMENLYKCHKEFLENIRLILSKEQWEELMLYLKKGKV